MTIEVILATAGYDHTIRFWEALSGICVRTIQHADSVLFLMIYVSACQQTHHFL